MPGIGSLAKKGMMYLRTQGIRTTARRTVEHFRRRRADRAYARRMTPGAEELEAQRKESESWGIRFSVVVPLYNTPLNLLEEMIASVRGQSYMDWELCLADGSDEAHRETGEYCRKQAAEDPRIRWQKLKENRGISGNSNAALEMASGDYIALLDHDDLLQPDALYEMAKKIRETGAEFLYSDEMIFVSPKVSKIVGIRFKPDFAPDNLLTNNYICHLTVFRRSLLEKTGPFRSEYDGSQDHDLILRLTDAANQVAHVRKVLYLWRSVPGSTAADVYTKEYAIDSGRRAVTEFLRAHGRENARVESTDVFPTMYRVTEPIEGSPSIRMILGVPGKPGEAEQARLRRLQEKTAWEKTVWKFAEYGPGTGRSRCQAFRECAEEAEEDYLLFMDGIPEPMDKDWVREMLMLCQQKEIGAVGAKLHFEGSTDLRGAGVILGAGRKGAPGRSCFCFFDNGVGFFGHLAVVQDVSAVTDCWIVSKEKYLEAGGFRPQYGDALFDVDLCLRLRNLGYRNLWTPYAFLQEGSARGMSPEVGKEFATYPADREIFQMVWREADAGDPYYNPNQHLIWR